MAENAGHEYLHTHQLSGEVVLIETAREADEVLALAKAERTGVLAKTLVKEGPLRVVIVGLRAGSTLQDHKAGGPVTVQLLEGTALVSLEGRSVSLQERQVMVVNANVRHSVVASGDAVLLLTVAWNE
jgi:quercetin dioxygenase-like cupin family protein